MSDGYGSTQATNTWITSDGSVTNYDPNTEMGFWISALHNECDRSAHLEREIERLREQNDYLSKAGNVMAEWVAVDHSVEQCEDGCEYLIALQDWKAVRGD